MKQKVMFVVQGEGRGHMTQAISMKQLLEKNGYDVCCALVGASEARDVPEFFIRNMGATHVERFLSPNFVTKNSRAIRILPTITYNIGRLRTYRRSIALLDAKVKEYQPDLVINFYDPLVALFYYLKRPAVPCICIAHQYLADHPDFPFPEGKRGDRVMLKNYTGFTAFGAKRRLALSFYETSNCEKHQVYVVPPLLRSEVFEQPLSDGGYFLVYLVNKGYRDDVVAWHQRNKHITLHCFTDDKSIDDVQQVNETLFFHQLNDKKFLRMMAGASGLVSTAGFESICEALYLGKPVFMVPVEGHFEQLCNSRDAFRAGAGIYDSRFDIDRFVNYLPTHRPESSRFRSWVSRAEELILRSVSEVIHEHSGEY